MKLHSLCYLFFSPSDTVHLIYKHLCMKAKLNIILKPTENTNKTTPHRHGFYGSWSFMVTWNHHKIFQRHSGLLAGGSYSCPQRSPPCTMKHTAQKMPLSSRIWPCVQKPYLFSLVKLVIWHCSISQPPLIAKIFRDQVQNNFAASAWIHLVSLVMLRTGGGVQEEGTRKAVTLRWGLESMFFSEKWSGLKHVTQLTIAMGCRFGRKLVTMKQ